MENARDRVLDMIYAHDAIRETRSSILQASSAICGCDGALCRLMELGKGSLARQIGAEVIPLAAEMTYYRLALLRGEGAKIAAAAKENATRSIALLKRIRSHY